MSSAGPVKPGPETTVLEHYDIVIVGGGINGAGIARDAAMRGLSVLLLEKNDFGGGTTSWSSRLIHGGLRYLEYAEIPLVYESLRERRILREVAPHLVKSIRLTIPLYEHGRRGPFVVKLGMLAYDLLSLGKKVPGHRMLNRDELIRAEPGLERQGLKAGAQYYDSQVTFTERLVMENVLSARAAGADVRNYSPAIGIIVRGRRVRAVQFRDSVTSREVEVGASVVINAAGPWVDRVLATVNREIRRFMGGTKGSHIVVDPFEGAPADACYVEARHDGRPFFIIPWNGQYLIGTTDIRYDGNPDELTASDEEIDYLLRETNDVIPTAALSRDDINFAYAGVRPLPRRVKGPESAITRKHIILKHRKVARGLISIIGGKITTYRNLAEQAVNVAVRYLDVDAGKCMTRIATLPGADDLAAARERLEADTRFNAAAVERLLSIYGSTVSQVLDIADETPFDDFIDAERTILAAEAAHAMRNEMARTLVDIVHRRMMIGLRRDQGALHTTRIAEIAVREAKWGSRELTRQLRELDRYNARLRPATEH